MYINCDLCYNLDVKSDAVLNLRVPAPIKHALGRAADANLRSLSSMAVWAMAEWLSENGYLDRDVRAPKATGSKRSKG
jgi:hypothetical protein